MVSKVWNYLLWTLVTNAVNLCLQVARSEDLLEQVGKDIYFDLVDHEKVPSFRIQKQTPFNLFKVLFFMFFMFSFKNFLLGSSWISLSTMLFSHSRKCNSMLFFGPAVTEI